MYLVYFSNAVLADASSLEPVFRTGDVPESIGTTHVWLLFTIFFVSVGRYRSKESQRFYVCWNVDGAFLEVLMKLDDA